MSPSPKSLFTRWVATLLLATAGLLMGASANAQELEAEVDRRTVDLNDTLTLTLRQSGRTLSGGPDFEPLRRDFDVLSNQRSHQMRIVNGDMESWTEWRLRLSPKRAGTLTIPAFEFEGKRSQAIEVTVQEQQRDPDGGGEDIFIETEVDKDSVYVQEQLLFTVRLYSRVNLDGAEMQPLEFENAVVTTVNEENYITQIDNRQHLVLEATFAIFPQQSGTLEIPSQAYEVAVSRGQRSPWGRSNRQRLRTDSREVQVKPTPAEFTGDTWLPARDMRLSEHWSKDPDNLKQGEPVTRRITLEADGLTAAQLPELTLPQTEGVTYYPDRPQTDEKVSAAGVQSSSTYTLAMVPNRSGRMNLPSVSVQWWDTESQQMRTAELPATPINVRATPGRRSETRADSSDREFELRDSAQPAPTGSEPPLSGQAAGWDHWHWLLLGTSALLLSIGLWLAVTRWRLKQELTAIRDLQREDRRRERISQGKAWHAVKRAVQSHDLKQLRHALLQWGQARWPDSPPRGLTDIARRIDSDPLGEQLARLDAALYRGSDSGDFDAKALVRELNQWRVNRRSNRPADDGLKPLYRSPS